MKKTLALGILLVSLVGLAPATARAGSATDAALGLGAFAVFNQMIGGIGIFGPRWAPYYPSYYYPVPAYASPPVTYYYPAPAVTYPQPPPPAQTEVVYPHGKYVLEGDGMTVAYQWVWIPNPPPAPPEPPAERK